MPVVISQRVHANSLQQPWRSTTVWKVSLAVRNWGQEFRSSSLSVSVAVSPMGVWAGDFGLVVALTICLSALVPLGSVLGLPWGLPCGECC